MSVKNTSNEFTLTRLYDASVEEVWEAWTDLQQVALWWGPRGFTITTHSKDLRVGGHWHYTMHGPDGIDYPNKTVYFAVDEYKRLVYDHGANDKQPPLFRVTVLFQKRGTKTQLEFTMACPTPEAAQQIQKFIKEAGGNSTWDRLAEYLKKKKSNHEIFVINRSFDAPIETLYDAWTQPKHFSQWLGPNDTQMEYLDGNIQIGKTTFYKMSYSSGLTMYGKMTYIKMEKPNYLEYTQIFCNEQGQLSKHPLVPVWPDTMFAKVFFTEEGLGRTRITLIWEPQEDSTTEAIEAFVNMRGGMTQGWTQSFDKLEKLLHL